jgi:hypothetical protein
MKLNSFQNLTTINDLKPLQELKPLTTIKVSIQVAPSEIELILLGTNLLYQSYLLNNGTLQESKDITALGCSDEAMRIVKILDDYENSYIDFREFNEINKKFKLKIDNFWTPKRTPKI